MFATSAEARRKTPPRRRPRVARSPNQVSSALTMFGYADGQPTPFPFVEAVGRNLSIRGYKTQGLMGDQEAMEKAKAYILAASVVRRSN